MNRSLVHLLRESWILILLRGIIAILFGVLALLWPVLTLFTLVLLFGAFALVDGVLALAAAFRHQTAAPRWWLVTLGIVGVLVGAATFAFPGFTELMLLMFIAVWFVVRGILEIAGAWHLRQEIDGEWLLALSGAVSVLFGAIMALLPGLGALALVWTMAVSAIVFGALLIGLAFRLRHHGAFGGTGTLHPA